MAILLRTFALCSKLSGLKCLKSNTTKSITFAPKGSLENCNRGLQPSDPSSPNKNQELLHPWSLVMINYRKQINKRKLITHLKRQIPGSSEKDGWRWSRRICAATCDLELQGCCRKVKIFTSFGTEHRPFFSRAWWSFCLRKPPGLYS